jgi:RHS repeat-associated protein
MPERPNGPTAADSDEKQSPFAAPQISLPKGGGAIRGIDEKFAINPATGTGSVTVPIPTSPGRSGFGPQLAVSYDSGKGNGPFGIGWSLSAPSITRKTDKGLPQYRDDEESDVFILSGAEDLVPVLTAKGRWRFDEFEREGYRIKRYRPRIEGLFARIERWTRISDGDAHWRSISRDNILTVYGEHAAARIADPEAPFRIFSWLISRSHDDRGNAILYDYLAEDGAGVPPVANERNRAHTANRYLKRVRFGNRRPLLVDPQSEGYRPSHLSFHEEEAGGWLFSLVFDYGEGHCRDLSPDERGRVLSEVDLSPSSEAVWPARPDPFSTYRAGFEVRTHRLCRHALMFHHFPEELGADAYLVRSQSYEYQEKPIGSLLARVVQRGHRRQPDGRYLTRALPPLDFAYSTSPLEDPGFDAWQIKEVDPESLANLPEGIDSDAYRWLDLDGEGIAGVMSEQSGAWYYKPNLGDGEFGPAQTVRRQPSLASLAGGRQQLLDLSGDGELALVELGPPAPGFYERTPSAGWQGFRAFRRLPVRDWSDPNLRFVDVTGDGIADVLVTEEQALVWHPSLLQEGFGTAARVRVPEDEERGPRVLFADRTQSIYLADMSGDGLSDIVRIRNHEVCYWPNLGYGRFGAKVTMDEPPWFDEPDQFDQRRVRLADTDGSGVSDVLYIVRDHVKIFLNRSGNSFSPARLLRAVPAADSVSAVTVTDFLGRGTACLLWSSPLPHDAGRPLRYLDLMCGRKPHLLVRTANNLGAETVLEYASSTEFYVADKRARRPWVTRLPFPVHVVKRVETFDYIGRNRFVTRYSYHHGYYDGIEREFRGFGRVDQLDSEEFAALSESAHFPVGENVDAASHVPPVLTRTWFHTGAFLEAGRISRHLAHEYWREPRPRGRTADDGPATAMQLDDTVLPAGLTPDEAREACRSLKGSMLRQEVYGRDEKDESRRPYTVSEHNYTIKRLQPFGPNRHAVFFTHARETVDFHYERKLYKVLDGNIVDPATAPAAARDVPDPRVTHSVTLEVDLYGNPLKAAALGYGRRYNDLDRLLTADDRRNQKRLHVTYTESVYTNPILEEHAYRAPLSAETRSFELVNIKPDCASLDINDLFGFHELAAKAALAGDGNHDLPYEDIDARGATGAHPYRRLIENVRTLYRKGDLTGPLPLGTVASRALPFESYKLAFTAGLFAIYRRGAEDLLPNRTTVLRDEAGYVLGDDAKGLGSFPSSDPDGQWWIPSGRIFYSHDPADTPAQELATAIAHFFTARRFRDPFGRDSTVLYDIHDLLLLETEDAMHNKTTVGNRGVGGGITNRNDYRVLQPSLTTDPNGNRVEAAFDGLGLVTGTAAMGKEGENLGDTLGDFDRDLTQSELADFYDVEDPHVPAPNLLKGATSRIIYDLDRFRRTRQEHPDDPTQWLPVYAATLARETHASDPLPPHGLKIQISFSYSDGFGREIQKKLQAEPGPVVEDGPVVDPRWVGSGWTIFNNKGKPVRQYEPFFSRLAKQGHRFEYGVKFGVSSILFYDPVERVVATLHPNHSWEKVVFDPWRQQRWDVNDTVLIADPNADADVGPFFRALPASDYSETWYAQRIDGVMGPAEQAAAQKASVHANTPAVAFVDTLGRPFLTVAHNRFERNGAMLEEKYATRVTLDIEGNQREVIDANGRIVMRYDYDMLGTRLHQASMEAGERWMLSDVTGKPVYAWDSRNHRFHTAYDPLRRPVSAFLIEGTGAERLIGRTVYGETRPDPESNNLRGKVVQLFDQAGVITTDSYDFKGNLRRSSRQLAREYKATLDWSGNPGLEPERFSGSTTYDALNRPISVTAPDASVYRPTFNEANLLEKVDVTLRGAQTPTPFVANIDYDAKGQRVLIKYGNHVKTEYAYDLLTFRLTNLKTTRTTDQARLQDLNYTYDPVGNITQIRDGAQQTVYFSNQMVTPDNDYVYDAVYRLINAEGREHIGQAAQPQTTWDDQFRVRLPQPGDGQAMRRYSEDYRYDPVGNFLQLIHQAVNGNWTRCYAYNEPSLIEPANVSNRLSRTTIGGAHPVTETYFYDAHGNMTSMPHLTLMRWDFGDRLGATSQQSVNAGTPETTYYVYDAAGQRVRKLTERYNGTRKNERAYLGGFEVYREYNGSGTDVTLERQTLHIMDDKQRIALVEIRTQGSEPGVPQQLIRHQFGNHLTSASLELDNAGQIISYEEYYPYGSTSYQAVRSQTETPKRYRYIGMERDEETGLNYHGARYYAPWLGRWISTDPVGIGPGLNLFTYAHDAPTRFLDTDGKKPKKPQAKFGDIKKYKSGGTAAEKQGSAIRDPNDPSKVLSEHEHIRAQINLWLEHLDPTTGYSPYDTGAYNRSVTLTIPYDMARIKTRLDMALRDRLRQAQITGNYPDSLKQEMTIEADIARTIEARHQAFLNRISAGNFDTADLETITNNKIMVAAHYQQGELSKVGKSQRSPIPGATEAEEDAALSLLNQNPEVGETLEAQGTPVYSENSRVTGFDFARTNLPLFAETEAGVIGLGYLASSAGYYSLGSSLAAAAPIAGLAVGVGFVGGLAGDLTRTGARKLGLSEPAAEGAGVVGSMGVGGGLGFVIAGPPGAAVGAIAGLIGYEGEEVFRPINFEAIERMLRDKARHEK